MAAKPPARTKPRRNTATGYKRGQSAAIDLADDMRAGRPIGFGPAREAREANDVSLALRIAGLESRVKAEARIAGERIAKLEARVDRMALALRKVLSERSNPSDGEDE